MRLEHDLVVITGKGLHSEDAPVLASEARGYLRTAFAPPLEIREVRGNAGRFVVPRVPQKVTGALFSRAANCERQSAGSRRSVHGIGRFKVLSAT